jgi:hypothetical protein
MNMFKEQKGIQQGIGLVRILIDTNIFIGRENNSVVPLDLQELLKLLALLRTEVLIHPKSVDEIENDPNEKRKRISLSKLEVYPCLESPPDPSQDTVFLDTVGKPKNSHDIIDNFMLYAVYKDAISYLITEDKGLQGKAHKCHLEDRVLPCLEAKELFESHLPKEKIEHPLALDYTPIHNIDLADPFFNSLKKEYPGFAAWFRKISQEGRKGYVHYQEKRISALLVFKDEKEAIPCVPPLQEHRRLKLCTFKSMASGNRLGELFIKLGVRYCVRNSIDEMYLTHFSKEHSEPFVELLKRYGFRIAGRKPNGEDVYLKKLVADAASRNILPMTQRARDVARLFYPSFCDAEEIDKFLVPIRPEYHDRLFDDYPKSLQQTIYDHDGTPSQFIVEGNTISKAYLCNSNIRNIAKHDILLFYRSQDWQEITALGVVESAEHMTEIREIAARVRSRTVYSLEEIDKMKKPTLVILFRWHFYLPEPVKLDRLIELKVLKWAPQSITKISNERYIRIKKESKLHGRYTVN